MTQICQLAAILFTDIVGYTAMMGKVSTKALELVRISKEIQKPLVEKHHGTWLKEMGDGAMAQFGSALDAVNCALEIQRTSRADFEGDLRIGIHLGDITFKNNDVYGDGVNVASRLESIADPGGIYISNSIEKAIRGLSNIQTSLVGEVKLKNVDYDVRICAVQWDGLTVLTQKRKNEHALKVYESGLSSSNLLLA
jgi:adenylate cyclase